MTDEEDNGGHGAGAHPAEIFAFCKLGYWLTGANRAAFNDDQIEEWETAVLEGMGVLGLWDDHDDEQDEPPSG